MKNINYKKLLIPNIPYVFIALFATKLGQAARLAPLSLIHIYIRYEYERRQYR